MHLPRRAGDGALRAALDRIRSEAETRALWGRGTFVLTDHHPGDDKVGDAEDPGDECGAFVMNRRRGSDVLLARGAGRRSASNPHYLTFSRSESASGATVGQRLLAEDSISDRI